MFPLTVSFRGLRHSETLASLVRVQAKALERLFPRILGCRVVLERPQRDRRAGIPLYVRVDVHVPGQEVVTEHHPSLHAELQRAEVDHYAKAMNLDSPLSDARFAIRQAFRAAARRLGDRADRRRETQRPATG